jgi:hypothetical protein
VHERTDLALTHGGRPEKWAPHKCNAVDRDDAMKQFAEARRNSQAERRSRSLK